MDVRILNVNSLYSGSRRIPDAWKGGAVVLGVMDGLHLGHQRLLRVGMRLARERNLPLLVLTFHPHPRRVLTPEEFPGLLTILPERLALFQMMAPVQGVVVLQFDRSLARMPPEKFIREILVNLLNARLVLTGVNFRFGHRREGDVALLKRFARQWGFDVFVQSLVHLGEEPVSSSRIRRLLREGALLHVRDMLEYPYVLSGPVVAGNRWGSQYLKVPTANLGIPEEKLLPAEGIYAGWAWLEQTSDSLGWLPAAVYVGRRPSFPDDSIRVEVHLIGTFGNFYGRMLSVWLEERIRQDHFFPSLDALRDAIHQDILQCERILQYCEPPPVAWGQTLTCWWKKQEIQEIHALSSGTS